MTKYTRVGAAFALAVAAVFAVVPAGIAGMDDRHASHA